MADTAPSTTTPAPASVAIDGAQVRELRKLSGKTVKQLAKHVDISFQYLSAIERGTRPFVSSPVFARICDGLNVENRRSLLREVAA